MKFVGSLLIVALSLQSQTADTNATAALIGVLPELAKLQNLPSDADRWQSLALHQQISEQVMAASLQVDAVIAQIDNEIARANEIKSYLADRRDRKVNRANLLSVIIGGGFGATSSGLQLSSALSKPAAGIGIGAGVFSASLALYGIQAQKGAASPFEFQSNMLARFFNRPALPDSDYPETVWTFLNQSPPGTETTRKQQLLDTWLRVQRIDSLASTEKISRLTSQPSENQKLTIDDFEDRAAMLQDVRARISFLKTRPGSPAKIPAAGHAQVKPFIWREETPRRTITLTNAIPPRRPQ